MSADNYFPIMLDIITKLNAIVIQQAADIAALRAELARCRKDWNEAMKIEAGNAS